MAYGSIGSSVFTDIDWKLTGVRWHTAVLALPVFADIDWKVTGVRWHTTVLALLFSLMLIGNLLI